MTSKRKLKNKHKLIQQRNADYCSIYDAWFNLTTRKWLEDKCGNKRCCFCSSRPRKHPKECACGRGVDR